MSSARKRGRQQKRPRPRPTSTDGMEPWLWAMLDADEAERRGDAQGALDAIRRRPLDPEGRLFWRPSRIVRLQQLTILAPFVPGWAVSRWVLEQALQHLDEKDRGPRSRTRRAVEVAVDLRGGFSAIEGRDEADRHGQVTDHDWVFRQVHLFELGGLDAFIRDAATPDLLAGADRVREWSPRADGCLRLPGVERRDLVVARPRQPRDRRDP